MNVNDSIYRWSVCWGVTHWLGPQNVRTSGSTGFDVRRSFDVVKDRESIYLISTKPFNIPRAPGPSPQVRWLDPQNTPLAHLRNGGGPGALGIHSAGAPLTSRLFWRHPFVGDPSIHPCVRHRSTAGSLVHWILTSRSPADHPHVSTPGSSSFPVVQWRNRPPPKE